MINGPKEFEADILQTFWGLKTVFSMSSLALLPARYFAAFEIQFLLNITQQASSFTNY